MKAFLKFIGIIVSVFGTVFGALAVFDKLLKKNYYICDTPDDDK